MTDCRNGSAPEKPPPGEWIVAVLRSIAGAVECWQPLVTAAFPVCFSLVAEPVVVGVEAALGNPLQGLPE